jgi:hypothetical protein
LTVLTKVPLAPTLTTLLARMVPPVARTTTVVVVGVKPWSATRNRPAVAASAPAPAAVPTGLLGTTMR